MPAFLQKRSSLTKALTEYRTDIDGLRDHILALLEERERIESLPPSEGEIRDRLGDAIDVAVRSQALVPRALLTVAESDGETVRTGFNKVFTDDPFTAMAILFGDRLRDVLVEAVFVDADGKPVRPRPGVPAEERNRLMMKVDADLLAAEIAEEVAIRDFESITGTQFLRRGDARPAILLAPDDELG